MHSAMPQLSHHQLTSQAAYAVNGATASDFGAAGAAAGANYEHMRAAQQWYAAAPNHDPRFSKSIFFIF